MRTFIAAVAAVSLAAAPAAAQPPQATEPSAQEQADDDGDNMKGELWGYLALPALIVVILLIAALRGEDEGSISP